MTIKRLERVQVWLVRLLLVTLLLLLAVISFSVWQGDLSAGKVTRVLGQVLDLPGLPRPQVAVVAGHRGFDTGAVCEDGLMEVSITEEVAELVRQELRKTGVQVQVLDEYDDALTGLKTDALVSLHADSCIDLSGFKIASAVDTIIPERDARLVACLNEEYAAVTGLAAHPATVTHDMRGYHAFQRAHDQTPGAIIEMGFLGGDRELLTRRPKLVAQGIVAGVICYLEGEERVGDW